MSPHAIKLYRHPCSYQSHCVELMLSLLALKTEVILVDVAQGMYSAAGASTVSHFGRVPAIDDCGSVVADSNAILIYLGGKYGKGEWLPSAHVSLGKVIQWLSLATGPTEELGPSPVHSNLDVTFGNGYETLGSLTRALELLQEMDWALASQNFLAGSKPTIADVSVYIHAAHAPIGNRLALPFLRVRKWLERMESLPGFVHFSTTDKGLRKRA